MAMIKAASAVEDVKIFLRGAEIKRRMVLDVEEGKNTAVFDGLPQDVRPESINASVEKGGILISADFEMENFREPVVSKDLKKLEEKYKKLKEEIREENSKLDILNSEEKFLENNRKIGGRSGFDMDELKEAEKYFRGRKEEINSSKLKVESRLEDLMKEFERMTKEMSGRPPEVVRYAGKISVDLYSESKGQAEVVVSYYVNNAWWKPIHEIRMNEIGDPIVLNMKGSIVQNTGEDWDNVNVKLSTGNPMLGNQQPILRPWYINFISAKTPRFAVGAYDEDMLIMPSMAEVSEEKMLQRAAPSAAVAESNTAVEYTLPAPLDIPSSNKPSKVELQKHVLEAEVFYYCVSKLDTDAFLIAKISGWESLNMIEGEVSIFQGNEYVGKTYLNPAEMDDDMEISLGRDKGVIVTREKGKDMTSKGMIGKNKNALREWIITVRNTKSKSIKMKLIDQLPISTDGEVTVDAVEISGAEHDKETGILTWTMEIPAGGSSKKVLKYEVSYPKTGTVYLD